MRKLKTVKKRRFKYRLILYAIIMFLGYELSYNIIMNFKLVTSNEEFVKQILINSNYNLLYEKKENDIMTKLFNKIFDIKNPVAILENVMHYKPNETMSYVNNPKTENVQKLNEEISPTVYIYNTHQSEEYSGQALQNYNIKPGVMMASYILQEYLAKENIKANVLEDNITDYLNLNNMKYNKSYIASRKFIETPIKENNYKLIIDLHRDSISKTSATTIINNKSCAKVLFVIGEEYDTYTQNLNVANTLNSKIKEKYPSLTRGILTKGGKESNGVYNQDINSKMILMELGTNETTINEVQNTIELIAPIIREYVNEN